jgi:hypothetical protein
MVSEVAASERIEKALGLTFSYAGGLGRSFGRPLAAYRGLNILRGGIYVPLQSKLQGDIGLRETAC